MSDLYVGFGGSSLDPRPSADRLAAQLCSRCSTIQLDKFIDGVLRSKSAITTHEGRVVCRLGIRRDWSLTCHLCALFRQATEREQSQKSRGYDRFVLRLLSRNQTDPFIRFESGLGGAYVVGGPLGYSNDPAEACIKELDVPLLAITSDQENDHCASGDLKQGIRSTGYISWVTSPRRAPAPGRGGLLTASKANLKLINEWLSYCREHHHGCGNNPMYAAVLGFQLIDCISNAIVPATLDMEYIALSYVWGTGPSDGAAVQDGNLMIGRLPLTVRDAMETAYLLGYNYLWVDRYCIPDDPAVKMAQIQQMDVIYRSASATLLAAAGEDATYGLPGISSRERSPQATAEIGRHTLFNTWPDPRGRIKRTTWMTRGWTYQEAMLSTRCIFFTDQQVYFECNGMQCYETLPPSLDAWHDWDKESFLPSINRPIFNLLTHNLALFNIWEYLSAYTQRNLSYDSDSLNGVLGILNYLMRSHALLPFVHWWGMPVALERDYRARGQQWHPDHCFINALLWNHSGTSKRRAAFPSWSWAGWEGKLPDNFLRHSYSGCNCAGDNSSFSFGAVSETGQRIPWTDILSLSLTKADNAVLQPRILQLTANTVRLPLLHFLEATSFISPGYYASHRAGRVSVDGAILKDCTIYATADLNDTRKHVVRRVGTEKFLCAIIGCYEARVGADMLMLDQLGKEVYERIGTVNLRSPFTVVGQLMGFETGTTRVSTRSLRPAQNSAGYTSTGSTCSRGDVGQRVTIVSRNLAVDQWGLEKSWRTLSIA